MKTKSTGSTMITTGKNEHIGTSTCAATKKPSISQVSLWQIIPMDERWYGQHLIAKKVVETLQGLNMQFPELESSMTIK